MNLTRDRVQSIGWISVLLICGAMALGLMLRVNAVKSEVRQTERRVVALRQDIDQLETEFQTRSNQQQLKAINEIDFGYQAPRAEQYIEGERRLAALGIPRGPGAPEPIRMAHGDAPAPQDEGTLVAMVSPITGTPANAAEVSKRVVSDSGKVVSGSSGASKSTAGKSAIDDITRDAAQLGNRLSRIKVARAVDE